MAVQSLAGAPYHGAKNNLKINERSGDRSQPTKLPAIRDRRLSSFARPFTRSEKSQTNRQCEERLGQACMEDCEGVLSQDDPQATKDALSNHDEERRHAQPTQPSAPFTEPESHCQHDHQ